MESINGGVLLPQYDMQKLPERNALPKGKRAHKWYAPNEVCDIKDV